ncbi:MULTISPECIES: diguanylate cyclase [unclassified Pseudomonas]|uniref:sensor domain-containing diguanylate cyclase n=1 Tax=unclassified Pseudomonas TaxID=196821 RepID=UPI001EFB3106|nr:diguanylate cyclase [Pseudomonas sp.]MCG8911084.1 diguanylate cyclase [Pseudomonas sp. DP-17]MDU4248932.1 diguanylate cyclase [Pseudomonas sp.]
MLKPIRVFCLTFLLAVLASLLAGWHMLQMKQDALAYAHATGKNTLLLVEREFHRDLDVHAQTLLTLSNVITGPTTPALSQQVLQELVEGHAAGSVQSGTLVVTDARGELLADLNHAGESSRDLSMREYFTSARDNPGRLLLSHPFMPSYPRSSTSTALSRAVLDKDGQFVGVVAAIKELQHMESFVRDLDLGKHGVITIRLLDGTVLAQWPHDPTRAHGDEVDTFREFVDSGRNDYFRQQNGTSNAYWRGYRRIGDYQAVVSVELCREAILNTWTARTLITSGLLVAINAATIFFAYRLTRDLRRRDAKESHLRNQADTDPLTGLHNRRWFDEKSHREWHRRRAGDGNLAVLMMDIDQFKAYNDHYGHPRGDLALVSVAHLVSQGCQREDDGAARYGGEEFVVILPGCDTAAAATVAESIRRSVEEAALPHEKGARGIVTISVGVASTSCTQAGSIEALIAAADANLYKAKEGGRNRVVA